MRGAAVHLRVSRVHLDSGGWVQYREESDNRREAAVGPWTIGRSAGRADRPVATHVPVLEGGQHYPAGGHRVVRQVPPGEVQCASEEDLL